MGRQRYPSTHEYACLAVTTNDREGLNGCGLIFKRSVVSRNAHATDRLNLTRANLIGLPKYVRSNSSAIYA
jgi:hypothetical protein